MKSFQEHEIKVKGSEQLWGPFILALDKTSPSWEPTILEIGLYLQAERPHLSQFPVFPLLVDSPLSTVYTFFLSYADGTD